MRLWQRYCHDEAVKLSYTLMYDGDPRTAADQVADLEQAGIDLVWVAEAYGSTPPP